MSEHIDTALERATAYIRSRQCSNGGFCYYRTEYLEEPNLNDTYHALAACKLQDLPLPNRQQLAAYVESCRTRSSRPDYLYYFGFARHLLGIDQTDTAFLDDIARLSPALPPRGLPTAAWYTGMLKITLLKKTFTSLPNMQDIVQFIATNRRFGGYGNKPNLPDTYLALSILAEAQRLPEDGECEQFVDDMQVPSLGFRCTRDSMFSHLEILHAGVFSCALLALPIRYPQQIIDFVLACQDNNGCFTLTPGSLGDLRTHWLALCIIRQLAPAVADRQETEPWAMADNTNDQTR